MLCTLQQLQDDSSEEVRASVVRALALTVPWLEHGDKHAMVVVLAMRALVDPSAPVATRALHWLLPAVAQWAAELGCLGSRLVAALMKAALVVAQARELTQLQAYVHGMVKLVPFVYAYTLRTAPHTTVPDDASMGAARVFPPWTAACDADESDVDSSWMEALNTDALPGQASATALDKTVLGPVSDDVLPSLHTLLGSPELHQSLHAHMEASLGAEDWQALAWVRDTWVPAIVQLCCELDLAHTQSHALLAQLAKSLCNTFGPAFARICVQPVFEAQVQRTLPQYIEIVRIVAGGAFNAATSTLQVGLRHRLLCALLACLC